VFLIFFTHFQKQAQNMTTASQLDTWCKKNQVKNFGGVFASDDVPTPYQPENVCYIVNHSGSKSKTGGTHWLACRIMGDKAYWFDSFGLPPHSPLENKFMGAPDEPDPDFMKWFKAMGVKNFEWNSRDIQSLASDVCGLYACYFCKHGLPQHDKDDAWRFLTKNVRRNDALIRELVRVSK
jgi:hypothetical protein